MTNGPEEIPSNELDAFNPEAPVEHPYVSVDETATAQDPEANDLQDPGEDA